MKSSEFRKLLREEITKVLKEIEMPAKYIQKSYMYDVDILPAGVETMSESDFKKLDKIIKTHDSILDLMEDDDLFIYIRDESEEAFDDLKSLLNYLKWMYEDEVIEEKEPKLINVSYPGIVLLKKYVK